MVFPEIENGRPPLRVYGDKFVIKISAAEASKQLREGEPSVELTFIDLTEREFEIGGSMLKDDKVGILIRRIREVLLP